MKCAEYKELALKRVKIWNDAKVRVEQAFDEWEERDKELADSIDVDDWTNPDPPRLDVGSFDDSGAARDEIADAKRTAAKLIEDVQEFLSELVLRENEFNKTAKEISEIFVVAREADRPVRDQLVLAIAADKFEIDHPYEWDELTEGAYAAVGDFVDDLEAWAAEFDDCEDE